MSAELEIAKIVYPGASLGYRGRTTVLTDEGLPGETVVYETLREKRSHVEGRTVRVLRPSPRRVAPRCGHYRACSPYQIMDAGLQLEVKAGQLREIFVPLGLDGLPAPGMEPAPAAWNYRNKVRFHVLWTEQGARPAYAEPGSRDVLHPIDVCHLAALPLQEVADDFLAGFKSRPSALAEIEVKIGSGPDEILICAYWRGRPSAAEEDQALAAIAGRHRPSGIVSIVRERGREEERVLWGRDEIAAEAGPASFRLGARSFFQVQPAILPSVFRMMDEAMRRAEVRRFADIYCGIGTFGLALAAGREAVYAIESEPANIRFLKTNAGLNRASNLTICEGTAGEWMPWVLERGIQAAILDPPRKGLEPGLVRGLAEAPPPLLLYLSCNPMTLARDIKLLAARYRVAGLRGFDFFPQTPHIETLAVLEKI